MEYPVWVPLYRLEGAMMDNVESVARRRQRNGWMMLGCVEVT